MSQLLRETATVEDRLVRRDLLVLRLELERSEWQRLESGRLRRPVRAQAGSAARVTRSTRNPFALPARATA